MDAPILREVYSWREGIDSDRKPVSLHSAGGCASADQSGEVAARTDRSAERQLSGGR